MQMYKCKPSTIMMLTHTPKLSVKDTHSGLLAGGLRGICWPARDRVMAARPPPVSCVCAVTRWEGGRGLQGSTGFCIKEPGKKEHLNLLDKKGGGRRGREEGGRKLTQSLFLLCRCFCVCQVEKRGRETDTVWWLDDTGRLNGINQIS